MNQPSSSKIQANGPTNQPSIQPTNQPTTTKPTNQRESSTIALAHNVCNISQHTHAQ